MKVWSAGITQGLLGWGWWSGCWRKMAPKVFWLTWYLNRAPPMSLLVTQSLLDHLVLGNTVVQGMALTMRKTHC